MGTIAQCADRLVVKGYQARVDGRRLHVSAPWGEWYEFYVQPGEGWQVKSSAEEPPSAWWTGGQIVGPEVSLYQSVFSYLECERQIWSVLDGTDPQGG